MIETPFDGLWLLLAENDPMLGPVLAELFEDAGAEVAGPWITVRAANQSLKARTPDAAILEVNLKDGDTYALAFSLQGLGVPYVFFSASEPSAAPAVLQPFAFLRKPASRREVLGLVRRLLSVR